MTEAFEPYVPPPYPYDRLDEIAAIASRHEGGMVDLSVGTPCDPPPASVVHALATSDAERGYPASIGSPALREAASKWIAARFGVPEPPALAACIGTKEFVGSLPQWLHLRRPDRDTVLYPSVSYPTYEMGAVLARCRAVPVPVTDAWRLDLGAIDERDATRALCLWVNSPSNPTGALDDLEAAAAWGRAHDVPVFSDECYAEFTWEGRPRTILEHGTDGLVAVHSLSKRSNLAGVRVGFYAGDPDLVSYLSEIRKHVGMMVPGPAQAAGVAALEDSEHVEVQRTRYLTRLERVAKLLADWSGAEVSLPPGGFYLWVKAPEGDGWAFTRRIAEAAGTLVSPGEFYGAPDHIRIAVVQPDDKIDLVVERLAD